VLPDTPPESAALMLDRLRQIIAELDWGAFSADMRVKTSVGVATLRPDETSGQFARPRRSRALRCQGTGTQPHCDRSKSQGQFLGPFPRSRLKSKF
jgi:hypothetical protein